MNRLRKVFNHKKWVCSLPVPRRQLIATSPKASETHNQHGSDGFRQFHRGPHPLKPTEIVRFIDISAENARKLAENSDDDNSSFSGHYHKSKVPFVIDKEFVSQFPAPPSGILPPNPAFANPKHGKVLGSEAQPSCFVNRRPAQRIPANNFSRDRARVPYFHANATSPSLHSVNSDVSSVRSTHDHSSYRTVHSNVSAQSVGSHLKQGPVAHRPVVHQAANLHNSTHFQVREWEPKYGTSKQDNASIRRKRHGQINPIGERLNFSPAPMSQPTRVVYEGDYYNRVFNTEAPRRY